MVFSHSHLSFVQESSYLSRDRDLGVVIIDREKSRLTGKSGLIYVDMVIFDKFGEVYYFLMPFLVFMVWVMFK